MIILQVLGVAVVLLGTIFVLGGVHPLHPSDSFLLTGVPIMLVELALAFCFARGAIANVLAGAKGSSGIQRIHRLVLVPMIIIIAAAMAPTVAVLYANQALDHSAGVTQTLPVLRTYSQSSKGSTSYYAVVPATPPPALLFASSQDDIELPRATWQRLVPGKSTLTLVIHPGRFGLPWYAIAGTTA